MKICIVANGFTGATLPLAQHLYKKGQEVECFYIVKCGTTCIESVDFLKPIKFAVKPTRLELTNKLYNYLDSNIPINLVSVFKKKRRLEKLFIGKIPAYINRVVINNLFKQIVQNGYDFVNIVIHTELELFLCQKLRSNGCNVCITFHEVLTGHVSTPKLKSVVTKALKMDIPIVVHSKKTKSDLLNLCQDQSLAKRLYLIHFGPFESYLSYGKGKIMGFPSNGYFLYLGHILPYKGLKYLFGAMNFCKAIDNVKIVVAGNGKDPILKEMELDNRFVVINRFIRNDELVGLIQNCLAIVCPYISASQSGLVQTGMVFNKKVVATKVGAFIEVIQNGINGYLAEPANEVSLADAMDKCLRDKSGTYSFHNNRFNWEKIAGKYIELTRNYENSKF